MRSALSVVPDLFGVIFNKTEDPPADVTPLKLQKILYYIQAWSLVFTDRPMFAEDLEAWVHGPVVRSVYYRYRDYESQNIEWTDSDQSRNLIDCELEIIRLVWRTYGSMRAKKLEELTHSEYPWLNARSDLGVNELSSRRISLHDMKGYYSRFVKNRTPPQINPIALLKNKERGVANKGKIGHQISGAGTNMSLFPMARPRKLFTPSDFSSERSQEAISSLWEHVGFWIQTSYDLVSEAEVEEHE